MRLFSRLALSVALIGALALSSCTNPSPSASGKADPAILASLTPQQQAAVRALIRDTLIENPDILTEASLALTAREKAKAMTKVMAEAADVSMGPKDAPITVVEFFDYRCGFCHAANDYVFNLVKTRKDVRVVFKELPILSAESEEASRAALAIHMQNPAKYPEFHRALMQFKGDLNMTVVERIAGGMGIDIARMKEDMDKPAVMDHISAVRGQAQELGINGTPGFIVNGEMVSGFNQPAIDAAINAAAGKT